MAHAEDLPEANPVSAEARGKARDFIRRATAEDDLRFALLTGFWRNIQQRMDRHPGSRIRSDKLKDIIHRWEVGPHQFRLRFEVEWKGKNLSAIEITASGNAALSGVPDWVADATELNLMINAVHPNMAGVSLTVAALMACASLLYATAGQAGGTAFLAIMAFGGIPAAEMRPTALLLNIIAAGYATWLLQRRAILDWKMLAKLVVPSLATAFSGGLLVLTDVAYAIVTGLLLIVAAVYMVVRRMADRVEARPIGFLPVALAGAGAGFVSGLTGVGGGVFLTPVLVGLRWYSPKGAAAISPPFILCNSIVGLAGAWLSGQRFAPLLPLYAISVLGGAVIGTATGLRWMSERATRYVLAAILLFAGLRLIAR